MVKHYFQLMNGDLKYVHSGDEESLKKQITADLGGDKATATKNIVDEMSKIEKQKEEIQAQECATEKEKAENEFKIAKINLSLINAQEEIDRIAKIDETSLVIFEMTQVDLNAKN